MGQRRGSLRVPLAPGDVGDTGTMSGDVVSVRTGEEGSRDSWHLLWVGTRVPLNALPQTGSPSRGTTAWGPCSGVQSRA